MHAPDDRPAPPYRVLWLGHEPGLGRTETGLRFSGAEDGKADHPALGAIFTLHHSTDASAALGELSASFQREARYATIFIDTEMFPQLEPAQIARVIRCIDPDVEIAFVVAVEEGALSAPWPSVTKPVSWTEVIHTAEVLTSRWRFASPAPEERREAPGSPVASDSDSPGLEPTPMPSALRRAALHAIRLLALVCLVPLVIGWQSKRLEPEIFTGVILKATDLRERMPWAILGNDSYAQINSHWLTWYYDAFRTDLASGQFGIIQWDRKFTCTAFVSRFASSVQLEYFARTFYRAHSPDGIAIGEFWYRPIGSKLGHALVAAFTEKGLLYLDPQNGHFVVLTRQEIQTAYLRKFD